MSSTKLADKYDLCLELLNQPGQGGGHVVKPGDGLVRGQRGLAQPGLKRPLGAAFGPLGGTLVAGQLRQPGPAGLLGDLDPARIVLAGDLHTH